MKLDLKPIRRWWKVYRDRRGEYRCSARASNGRVTWASSEGYTKRFRAVRNAIENGAPQSLHKAKLGEELRTWNW